jgi:histidinol-phosphate/aromatic aminotransferase/cobyric acid decarboxylase-like protein
VWDGLLFGSEHALAQPERRSAPDDAIKINANEFPEAAAARARGAGRGGEARQPLPVPGDRRARAASAKLRTEAAALLVYPGSSLALHHAVISFTSPARARDRRSGYEAGGAAEFIGAKVCACRW